MKKIIQLSIIMFALNVNAQDGILDTSFGPGGKVTTAVGGVTDQGNSLALQTDGKLVVAGRSYNGSNYDFAVVRYNTNGILDNTFGTSGKVTTDVGSGHDGANSLAIQTDGKLVVAGYSNNGSNNVFAVVRYNSDGNLDTSFGTGGKVTIALGSGNDEIKSLVIQTDGKIVAAGSSHNGTNYDFAVVRYNSDGTLDPTFGTGGKVTTTIGSGSDNGYSLAIQTDGRIVVAGYSLIGTTNDFAVVRYNTNGSLDTSFGTDGKVTTAVGNGNDQGSSLAIQTDGKLVVAGYSHNGTNIDFAVVRYNSDGNLDLTFGTNGKVTTAVGSSNDQSNSLAIQPDGKLVVSGYSNNGSNNDFAVVRYNSDGSLDTPFGTGGKVTTAVGSGDDLGASLAIQPDGKLVVAGNSKNGTNYFFAVVRYNNSLLATNNFSLENQITLHPNPATDTIYINGIDNATTTIFDMNGRALHTNTISKNSSTINISNLPKGIYLIEIITDKGTFSKKIVKQ